jgi:gamma-D-glutamyl-L-lysine dipeptidyl-peptidase
MQSLKHVGVAAVTSVMPDKRVILILIFFLFTAFTGCSATNEKSVAVAALTQSEKAETPVKVGGILMDEKAAVIADSIVDIFSEPDIRSERITQALYNQPVSILDEKSGWARVAVVDGSRGWVRTKFLDRNITSIYGRESNHRIVVTSKEKSIFSSPSGGYTVKDVVMGTELLSFNDYSDAYEVYLPGNRTGWLRGSGIMHIEINGRIPVTKKEDFVATALKFKGTSYLLNGLSSMGMDSSGLVYISGRINGLDLSRNIGGQHLSGSSISMEEAREGDLVFFAPGGDTKAPACVGICIGNGSYIYAGRLAGYVLISSLNEANAEGQIIAIRRIFS